MKILLVSEFFPFGKDLRFSGGVEARTFFIAKSLAKKHEVIVICSRQSGSKKMEKMFDFTVHRVGPLVKYNSGALSIFGLPSRIRFVLAAVKKGARLDIDLAEGGNFTAHFIAKEISIKKRIPVIFWYPDVFLGEWIFTLGLVGGFIGWLVEKINLLRSADFFIAISKETEKKLKKVGVSANKISTIYCGVDSKEFQITSPKNHLKTIIIISRLVKYKNVDKVIVAFARVLSKLSSQKAKKINLKIIGSGPEKSKLSELSKQLKISDHCKFLENLPRKQLIKELKSSSIFSLPSLVEGFGIVTIEAAAAGLPYVNSNIPVQKEVTKGGVGGFLVNPMSPVAFSEKFLQLLVDQKLYSKKVRDAKILAKNYDWQQIAKKTENIYKSVLKLNE